MRTAPVTAEVYRADHSRPAAPHTLTLPARASSPLASAPRGVAQAPAPTGGPRARGYRRRLPAPRRTSTGARPAQRRPAHRRRCERENTRASGPAGDFRPCSRPDCSASRPSRSAGSDRPHPLPRSRLQEVPCDQEPVSDQERQPVYRRLFVSVNSFHARHVRGTNIHQQSKSNI